LFVPDPVIPQKPLRAHGCGVGTMEMKALSFVALGAIGRRSTYPYYYRTAAHFSCEPSKLLQHDGYAFETASHVVDHFIIGFAE
jgi:hypothetical protein